MIHYDSWYYSELQLRCGSNHNPDLWSRTFFVFETKGRNRSVILYFDLFLSMISEKWSYYDLSFLTRILICMFVELTIICK